MHQHIRQQQKPKNIVYFPYLLPALIWAVLIMALMLMPGKIHGGLSFFKGADKLVHVILYQVFALLILLGFNIQNKKKPERNNFIIPTFLACALYGIALELFQHWFIENRTGSIWDAAFNMLGLALGALIFSGLQKLKIA